MMSLGAMLVGAAEHLARFTEARSNLAAWFGDRWSVVVDFVPSRALVGVEVLATMTEQPGEVDLTVRVWPVPFVVVHAYRQSTYTAWLGTCAEECECCPCCRDVPCPGVCAGAGCDGLGCSRESDGGEDDDDEFAEHTTH